MTPAWGQNLAWKWVFTPIFKIIFCLHTVTTGFGVRYFDCFLRYLNLLTEIYPGGGGKSKRCTRGNMLA